MIKKILKLAFIFALITNLNAFCADEITSTNSMPNAIPLEQCQKRYPVTSEKLFYSTLSSITDSNFKIVEIQSTKGYISFDVWGREFLAMIAKIDDTNSMIKITPMNNSYYFSPWIIQRLFANLKLD